MFWYRWTFIQFWFDAMLPLTAIAFVINDHSNQRIRRIRNVAITSTSSHSLTLNATSHYEVISAKTNGYLLGILFVIFLLSMIAVALGIWLLICKFGRSTTTTMQRLSPSSSKNSSNLAFNSHAKPSLSYHGPHPSMLSPDRQEKLITSSMKTSILPAKAKNLKLPMHTHTEVCLKAAQAREKKKAQKL